MFSLKAINLSRIGVNHEEEHSGPTFRKMQNYCNRIQLFLQEEFIMILQVSDKLETSRIMKGSVGGT